MPEEKNETVSVSKTPSQMGVRIPTISEDASVDGISEDAIRRCRPNQLTRADIGRLAENDKCYLGLKEKLQDALDVRVPTPAESSILWRNAARAYAVWAKSLHEKDWKAETVRILRGRLGRRLIELREKEEMRWIHMIKGKLGIKYLHQAGNKGTVLLKRRSPLRYARQKVIDT